ncbi:hypothetical protein [Rhizobium tibeticum]|uniref:hypothetical protein n=1 Tax=Rhizobium tibeticum TaxID=501024 RepID=UPI000B190860|nr:hypothetical protein [Rhizobium tibeticum]
MRTCISSEVGGAAKLLTASLVILFLAINVLNSFVGRNFMTAIADRHVSEFARQTVFYLVVWLHDRIGVCAV